MISMRFAFASMASVGVAAAAAAALTVDFDAAARQHRADLALAQQSVLKNRQALQASAGFDGTPVCFKASRTETSPQSKECELMVWYVTKGKKETTVQVSVMPLTGPHAGIGVTFQPSEEGGMLRIRHLASEQKVAVGDAEVSMPVLIDEPVEYVYHLRDFPSVGSTKTNLNAKMAFKTAHNGHVIMISGDILKGRPFEIKFNRQQKLAVNLEHGNFVFNTFNANTFYGKYKVMPAANPVVEAVARPAF